MSELVSGRFEAVVFDCDGLLLDTEDLWEAGEARLLAAYGHEYTKEERRRLLGVSVADSGRIVADILGMPDREAELLAELQETCREIILKDARPMPGAEQLVADLEGRYPLGVASNAPSDLVRAALEKTGLIGAFGTVLGDGDVQAGKPAPDLYLLACERLGARPGRSVALEDSPTGAAAARAAGTFVIGIPSEPGATFKADLIAASLEEETVRRLLLGEDGRG